MTASLTLTYDFSRDDDDFGWLQAKVQSSKASGVFGFWVQWQDVEQWGETLFRYPIPRGDPLIADWGQSDSDGGNYQPIVKVTIAPIDRSGHLEVVVHLSDHADQRNQCRAAFGTTHAELGRFAVEIREMMARRGSDAELTGQDFG